MRHLCCFLIAVSLLAVAAVSSAQPNSIGIFSDTRGCPCEITDYAPGIITMSVLHLQSPGAKAVQFSAPQPSCFNAIWLTDTYVFPTVIGNSQTGLAVGYGQCMTGTFQILTITYFGQGLTQECCYYQVLPDPYVASGHIEVVDCDDQIQMGYGWTDIINSTPSCQCLVGLEFCYPVAVEEHTWGKIKSLYK